MYQAVTEENSRKNLVFDLLQQVLSGLLPDNYAWAFDANRVLRVKILGRPVTAGQMAAIHAACSTRFGPGKVVVVA